MNAKTTVEGLLLYRVEIVCPNCGEAFDAYDAKHHGKPIISSGVPVGGCVECVECGQHIDYEVRK